MLFVLLCIGILIDTLEDHITAVMLILFAVADLLEPSIAVAAC